MLFGGGHISLGAVKQQSAGLARAANNVVASFVGQVPKEGHQIRDSQIVEREQREEPS